MSYVTRQQGVGAFNFMDPMSWVQEGQQIVSDVTGQSRAQPQGGGGGGPPALPARPSFLSSSMYGVPMPLLLAGAGAAVYFLVLKKKK